MIGGGTYIPRKVYEPGGFAYTFTGGKIKPLPRHVAGLIHLYTGKFQDVTWAEILEDRRKRQAERLERIYYCDPPKILPCYVWTFFNRQDIPYHGWYCYVVTRHYQIAVNFKHFDEKLAISIMTAIPLGLFPIRDNFEEWMEKFAKTYRRRAKKDPRKAGSFVGWINDKRIFTIERPSE